MNIKSTAVRTVVRFIALRSAEGANYSVIYVSLSDVLDNFQLFNIFNIGNVFSA